MSFCTTEAEDAADPGFGNEHDIHDASSRRAGCGLA